MKVINKWLDRMEERLNNDKVCCVYDALFGIGYIDEEDCDGHCELCGERMKTMIAEIREKSKHQNMTIRNLIEIACFNFSVNMDGNYCEIESLPNDLISFVYGEDFLNQEISLIEKDADGKIRVTLKEK